MLLPLSWLKKAPFGREDGARPCGEIRICSCAARVARVALDGDDEAAAFVG